jgi:acyl carrier protein
MTPAELLDSVITEVARLLGHDTPRTVDPDLSFKALGFDSAKAVELRNRLSSLSGLRLPATVVFDHPTPVALAHALAVRLAPESASASENALGHLAMLENALGAIQADRALLATVTAGLRGLLSKLGRGEALHNGRRIDEELRDADDDELLALIERELGGDP